MKTTVIFLIFTYFHSVAIAKLYDTEWWKHTIIYELIPYSFKDSDGNGVGDLKGKSVHIYSVLLTVIQVGT